MSPRRSIPARVCAAVVLAVAVLLTGCGTGGAPAVTVAPAPPKVTGPPRFFLPGPSHARAAVDAATASAAESEDVTFGVAVLDLATNEVTTNDEGDTRLRAASLAKLYTVVDVLMQRESSLAPPDPDDDDRIRAALGPSDDDAMNALWSTFGGATAIPRISDALGLSETSPPGDESQWGEVETSARDVATLYGYVLNRLAPPDRDLVLGSLAAAPPTAADGFDQGFGLLDPAQRGSAIAKQGWLCCLESSIDLHSAGLPDASGRYVVVLLSQQSIDYDEGRRVLDDAAGAARRALAGP